MFQPPTATEKKAIPAYLTRAANLCSRGKKLAASPAGANFLWLAMDRGFRLFVALFIGSWSAQYLGPDNFGLLNFSMAIIAVFTAVAPLGMEGLAVRHIIQEPLEAGKWLGTVVVFRGFAATLFAFLAVAVSIIMRPHDSDKAIITGILGVGMAVQSLESGELLFQARTQMRRLIIPRLCLSAALNAAKIVFILNGMPVFWFAAVTAIEQGGSGILTFLFMKSALGKNLRLRFHWISGVNLLKRCWPLAISALTVVVYMKASQLIMNFTLSDRDLGIFAAGIRIPETMSFLPTILASSLLPNILRSKALGEQAYRMELLRYFRISSLVGYLVCLPLSIAAFPIINLLYKHEFQAASSIMMVYSWSFLFVCLGVARAQYLLNEGMTRLSLLFSAVGLVTNLALNSVLIPRFGAIGSAYATVVSYAFAALGSTFFVKSLRDVGKMQVMTLLAPWRLITN